MSINVVILCAAMAAAALLLVRRLGVNLSLASVLVSFLLLFHGPAYLYYTRMYGPDTDVYDIIVAATRGSDVLPTMDVALALAFVFVSVGILFTDLATGTTVQRWRRAIRDWSAVPLRADPVGRRRFLMAASVLALVLLIPFIFIDGQLPKVIEFSVSDLNELEKIALRREGGGSSFYFYNLALGNVVPFVAFGLLALALARVRGVKAWTAAFFVLVAMGKAATLSKAPLAVFVLQCAIVWVLMRRLTLSWRAIAILGVLATALFILMSWIANPTADELLAVLEFLFYRVFMIVNESLLEYFAAIPAAIPHSWGTQSSWIAALFQTDPKLPTFWLVGEVHRGALGSTTTAMFVGDAWADFAWAGVVSASFAAGAIARYIDVRLVVARGRNVATVAGLAIGHYGLFIAMSTSLQTAMVTGGLLLVLPLVSLMSPPPRRRESARRPPAAPEPAGSAGGLVPTPLAST